MPAGEGAHVIRGQSPDDPALPSRFHHEVLNHPDLRDGKAFHAFMLDCARAHSDHTYLPTNDRALLAIDAIRPELDGLMLMAAPPVDCVRAALDAGLLR